MRAVVVIAALLALLASPAHALVPDVYVAKGATLPTPRSSMAGVWTGEEVLLFGGWDPVAYGHRDEILAYDPWLDTLRVVGRLPTARCCMDAELFGGNVYLVGGITVGYAIGPSQNEIQVFDLDTLRTSLLPATLPDGDSHGFAALHGSTIYTFGQYMDGQRVDWFDPTTGTVGRTSLAAEPADWQLAFSTGSNVTFIPMGLGVPEPVRIMDPASRTWVTTSATMLDGVRLAGAYDDDVVHLYGGGSFAYPDWVAMDRILHYDPVNQTIYEPGPTFPVPLLATTAVFIPPGMICVFGGQNGLEHHSALAAYDTIWCAGTPPPAPAANASFIVEPRLTCIGRSVLFAAAEGVSWEWDFGDSSTASGQVVEHAYGAHGNYTVTLRVINKYGSTATATQTVSVGTAMCPPRLFVPSAVQVQAGELYTICFDGQDGMGGRLEYAIQLPPGATQEGACFTWRPSTAQLGELCVRVTLTERPSGLQEHGCALVVVTTEITAVDQDRDGVADDQDNCPTVPNTAQRDDDQDGEGNACDKIRDPPKALSTARRPIKVEDLDGDGIIFDNCPEAANPDQADLDGDTSGDACDADLDGDGVPNMGSADAYLDNCPTIPNPGQGPCEESLPLTRPVVESRQPPRHSAPFVPVILVVLAAVIVGLVRRRTTLA